MHPDNLADDVALFTDYMLDGRGCDGAGGLGCDCQPCCFRRTFESFDESGDMSAIYWIVENFGDIFEGCEVPGNDEITHEAWTDCPGCRECETFLAVERIRSAIDAK